LTSEEKKASPTQDIVKSKGGRPPGSKNKTTLFKEAMRGGFENILERDGLRVFEAVVSKAIEGDMTAAKLIMDRVLPTSKAIDLDALERSAGLSISINVGSLEKQLNPIDAEVVVEDE